MPRFIVPYKGLNALSHFFIMSLTMTFGLLYKIKMIIRVCPPYSWNYSNNNFLIIYIFRVKQLTYNVTYYFGLDSICLSVFKC